MYRDKQKSAQDQIKIKENGSADVWLKSFHKKKSAEPKNGNIAHSNSIFHVFFNEIGKLWIGCSIYNTNKADNIR